MQKGVIMRPAILFIGDSITLAYAPVVRELLRDEADVYPPEENSGTSENVLLYLDAWVHAHPADILHLNCGLHDLAIDAEATGPRVPVTAYADNLRQLRQRLHALTSARLIWATCTPVIDEWHLATKGFTRRAADVVRYNDAARAVMGDLPLDDLYAVVTQAGVERCICEDGVHMTDVGNRLLAEAVAHHLRTFFR